MEQRNLRFYRNFIAELRSIREQVNNAGDKSNRANMIFGAFNKASEVLNDDVRGNYKRALQISMLERNEEIDDLIAISESMLSAIPSPFEQETINRETRDAFDRKHNVKTNFMLEHYAFPETISFDRLKFSSSYHPCPVVTSKSAITALSNYGINYADSVFIDVGSGAGRVLLIASNYPFRKLVGIEISQYLHNIALSNVKSYKNEQKKCDAFELHCLDARDFIFPEENLVLFFWEPFLGDVQEQFIKNLEIFVDKTNRQAVLIFVRRIFPAVIKSEYFKLLNEFVSEEQMEENKGGFPVTVFSNYTQGD